MLNQPTNACNCENSHCAHGGDQCPNEAGTSMRVMYVGAVCSACFQKMDPQYRVEPVDPITDRLRAWLDNAIPS
jgi:hypothetical protein